MAKTQALRSSLKYEGIVMGKMQKALCIVPCGKKKIWDKNKKAGPAPAREVYIGPFAKKCKEYAETFFPDSYCILSAKYGFLFPDDIVPGQYNVSFNEKTTKPITLTQLADQASRKKMLDIETFVVLGGRNYADMIKSVFPGKEIITPLSNCAGIGYMLQKLDKTIKSGVKE